VAVAIRRCSLSVRNAAFRLVRFELVLTRLRLASVRYTGSERSFLNLASLDRTPAARLSQSATARLGVLALKLLKKFVEIQKDLLLVFFIKG